MFETILAGVTIFVLGQVFLKMVIDPVQKLKSTLGEIAHALVYYASVYGNPGSLPPERSQEAYERLRDLSSQLAGDLRVIPLFSITRFIFFLPARESLISAQREVIGLSNGVYSHGADGAMRNLRLSQKIADALGILVPKHERVSEELLDDVLAKK